MMGLHCIFEKAGQRPEFSATSPHISSSSHTSSTPIERPLSIESPNMETEDTPRSLGYGSPRDDRFFTPRSVMRGNSSNSDEWNTPRYETPRYGDYTGTPRSARSNTSDENGQFQTPRTGRNEPGQLSSVAERKRTDSFRGSSSTNLYAQSHSQYAQQHYEDDYKRGNMIHSARSNTSTGSQNASPRLSDSYYDNYHAAAQAKASSTGYSQRLPPAGNHNYNNNVQYGAQSKQEHKSEIYHQNNLDISQNSIENDDYSIDILTDGVADLGKFFSMTEQDVEDIFSFARHGRSEEIEKLLTKGLPVDVRDSYGNTVLTIACQNGNKRVAKAVLRRGANINARNHKGNTPLHYCYHYGYGDTLGQYIIEKGADPNARNNAGKLTYEGI